MRYLIKIRQKSVNRIKVFLEDTKEAAVECLMDPGGFFKGIYENPNLDFPGFEVEVKQIPTTREDLETLIDKVEKTRCISFDLFDRIEE